MRKLEECAHTKGRALRGVVAGVDALPILTYFENSWTEYGRVVLVVFPKSAMGLITFCWAVHLFVCLFVCFAQRKKYTEFEKQSMPCTCELVCLPSIICVEDDHSFCIVKYSWSFALSRSFFFHWLLSDLKLTLSKDYVFFCCVHSNYIYASRTWWIVCHSEAHALRVCNSSLAVPESSQMN